jgi:rhodanese-related sulfurtransferase
MPLTKPGQKMPTSTENERQSEKYCQLYRNKFIDVPYLSSDHLLAMYRIGAKVVLVDVRSDPERQVSMLEGAVTKEQFHQRHHELTKNDDASVVTYCTIGYRSGLEARRISLLYPHLKDRVWSLDGVVSLTHALGRTLEAQQTCCRERIEDSTIQDSQNDPVTGWKRGPLLFVNRQTGTPTNHVHTFGAMWGCVDDQNFKAVHFSFPEILVHLLQVCLAITTCSFLSLHHYFTRGSLQKGRRQQDQ